MHQKNDDDIQVKKIESAIVSLSESIFRWFLESLPYARWLLAGAEKNIFNVFQY